jgi:hypothetical protein
MRIEIGRNTLEGGKVYLEETDWLSHLHITGATRAGKSVLLALICQQFIKQGKQFALIDPHGTLYRDILTWIVSTQRKPPIVLFNPSYEPRIVGYNPWQTDYTDEARIRTKAERMCQATVRVFGFDNSDRFGNIERWLRNIYFVLLEQRLSLYYIRYFLYWHFKTEREEILSRVRSQAVRDDLTDFYDTAKIEFKRDIQSTRNKVQRFTQQQMMRIIGVPNNNIDLKRVVNEERILLCNLQAARDDLIGHENNRVLGTLLIDELWEIFQKRTKPQEFYLVVDEAADYLTPTIARLLPAGAKRGLHMVICHQDKDQLDQTMRTAVKQAQTKIMFSTEEFPKEQRQFTLRRANHSTVEGETLIMPELHIEEDRLTKYIEYLTQYFMTVEEVDSILATPHNEDTPNPPKRRVQWKIEPKT